MHEMKRVLLACDLDNTVIHSYKHKKDGEVCIEWIDGKEQSYIDRETYDALPILGERCLVIPVTTRSVEQYQRIKWPDGWGSKCAVAANGGILLDEGVPDTEWVSESREAADLYIGEMERLAGLIRQGYDYSICRIVDGMYLYFSCKEGVPVSDKAAEYSAMTRLEAAASGKKIYFFPPRINKGEAVKRLRERFSPDYVIAAGDSCIDIPMLNAADLAICKKEIYPEVMNPNKALLDEGVSFIGNILGNLSF